MNMDIILREECETIKNQIQLDNPKSTKLAYHNLLKNGYQKEEAIYKLALRLHGILMNMLTEQTTFDEQKWESKLQDVIHLDLHEAEEITAYQLKKMPGKLRKEYGFIEHGDEENYIDGLAAYENNLLSISNLYQLNSRQLREVVEVWMYQLYGSLHHQTYDYRNAVEEEIIETAIILSFYADPFQNPQLLEDLKQQYPDVDDTKEEIIPSIFKMAFLLLGRIHDSINFWEKEYGSNGYITYLKSVF